MSVNKQQSAIKEVRDQLFLDTADGVRLNVVTSNLGLDRPLVGIDDDEWRTIAKAIGLQPKLVRNVFYRLMETCIGPRTTRIATLESDSFVGSDILQGSDVTDLRQLGTFVFSPGQVTEETAFCCYRDVETGKIFLTSSLLNAHTAIDDASGHLLAATASGAASLVLTSTKTFPTAGFPYSIVLARGTEVEESVAVTANSTLTNTLTLLNPTVNDHVGPQATFVNKRLDEDAPSGRVFVRLDSDATRVFPGAGYIRLAFGAGNAETKEYESNDIEENILYLRFPLENSHLTGEPLELVTPGASVETCSVLQQGVGWELYETVHRKIKVYAPSLDTNLRLRDASWFHDDVPAPFATTLASNAAAEDLIIDVTAIAGFPDEAGIINIDGVTKFYIFRDEDAGQLHLSTALGVAKLAGDAVALVLNAYPGTNLDDGNLYTLLGAFETNKFPGPYLYDITQRAPSMVQTTLDEAIPFPTTVAQPSVIGQTCLEVRDAFTWPASPFATFDARLGSGTASVEDVTVTDRTLKSDVATTVDILPAPNPGALTLQGVDTTGFPQSSNGLDPANYRIIVDEGGGNEEILLVVQNSAAVPGVFTLGSVTTIAHAPGETIGLVNDVLTLDPMTAAHAGPSLSPTVVGHSVEPLTTKLELAAGGNFDPNSGTVLLNFGKGRPNARARITSIIGPTVLEFADTSVFPDATDPYPVRVGDGLPVEAPAQVTNNNTGLNQLTFAATLPTLSVGDYVEFTAGTPIAVTYADRDTNTLDLPQPTVLSGYTKGEVVVFSFSESAPSELGSDYAMLMPPDATFCLTTLFDLVRAAGVEIEFLENT